MYPSLLISLVSVIVGFIIVASITFKDSKIDSIPTKIKRKKIDKKKVTRRTKKIFEKENENIETEMKEIKEKIDLK